MTNNELIEKMMQAMLVHSRLRKNYFSFIESNDFDGFIKHFNIYIKETSSKESLDSEFIIQSIKEFDYLLEVSKHLQDRVIDFFQHGNIIGQKNIILSLWMCPQNGKYSRYDNEELKNDKYINFFDKKYKITKKYYTTFCDVLNKDEFKKKMNIFLEQQSKYIFNEKLNNKLPAKTNKAVTKKI